MRSTTKLALTAAGAALAASGTIRADDAAPRSTTGTIVLAAGDKAHGKLRGGETNALRVHLAKGDVYSFSVASTKRDDPLVMHLTIVDPSGAEINDDARVAHYANGKRITVGPYRAPTSGTYVIELYAQTWFAGDYWATSSVRAARTSRVKLPADGTSVPVEVSAGSTIRLRADRGAATLDLATPSGRTSTLAADDPLLASLRTNGVATAETGTYRFGAKGSATIEVTKPRWRAKTVVVPTLPDDPTRLAQFDFVLGWYRRPLSDQSPQLPQPTVPPPAVGGPVVVDAPTATPSSGAASAATTGVVAAPAAAGGPSTSKPSGAATSAATLAVDGVQVAATMFKNHTMPDATGPSDPTAPPPDQAGSVTPPASSTPPVDAPSTPAPPFFAAPPATAGRTALPKTSAGTPERMAGLPQPPYFGVAKALGCSAFASAWGSGNWSLRDVPWTNYSSVGSYPRAAVIDLMPTTEMSVSKSEPDVHGDDSDPFVRQTFRLAPNRNLVRAPGGAAGHDIGQVVTTMRYFIDGHQVGSLFAAAGDSMVEWTVSGEGTTVDDVAWKLYGSWTMTLTAVADDRVAGLTYGELNGREDYAAGAVSESLEIRHMILQPIVYSFGSYSSYYYDPVGAIVNTLFVPELGLQQTYERDLVPAVPFHDMIDRTKSMNATTVTIDASTPPDGVEDIETYAWTLC